MDERWGPGSGPVIVVDEAHAALRALPPAGRTGKVAGLLREMMTAGRDSRLMLEPRLPRTQHATLEGWYAAALGDTEAFRAQVVMPTIGGRYRTMRGGGR